MRAFAFVLLTFLAVLPVTAADPDPDPPNLMHASSWGERGDVSSYLVSEKLDGVRGHWTGERLLTRGGHAVDPPEWFTAGWPSTPMDGELWLGRGRFAAVSGIVRTREPVDAEWREVRFMVFDLPAHEGPFEVRARRIRTLLDGAAVRWLQPVRQFPVANADALDQRLERIVDAGGEGLMLHRRDAHYRAGRSDTLLKYKTSADAEARVVAHTPGRGRYRGMLGALVVERPDGLRFRLGTGFSDAQRADPPPVGSRVTYRYNGFTVNGVPRFARFLRLRPRRRDSPKD
ncbi:DNA ligase [Halofilum ochraceum]|uniref:DNA ligase n=1 Tax=Halofilum ochraceum TaxID=1611323 RepID=UPI0008DB16CC|nr:DNA ligase [Halofilum ochraceum]